MDSHLAKRSLLHAEVVVEHARDVVLAASDARSVTHDGDTTSVMRDGGTRSVTHDGSTGSVTRHRGTRTYMHDGIEANHAGYIEILTFAMTLQIFIVPE